MYAVKLANELLGDQGNVIMYIQPWHQVPNISFMVEVIPDYNIAMHQLHFVLYKYYKLVAYLLASLYTFAVGWGGETKIQI